MIHGLIAWQVAGSRGSALAGGFQLGSEEIGYGTRGGRARDREVIPGIAERTKSAELFRVAKANLVKTFVQKRGMMEG